MRYVKVPVEFGKTRAGRVWCQLHDIYEGYGAKSIQSIRGRGSTEEEAFTDLLTKLGYEEAKEECNEPITEKDIDAMAHSVENHFKPNDDN